MGILYYPYFLLGFWYKDVLFASLKFSQNFLLYWLQLVSVPILVKTFFKPLKNEYREGLVVFSITIGIIVKSLLLIAIFLVTLIILLLLVVFNLALVLLPVFIIRMLTL